MGLCAVFWSLLRDIAARKAVMMWELRVIETRPVTCISPVHATRYEVVNTDNQKVLMFTRNARLASDAISRNNKRELAALGCDSVKQ